MLIKCDLQVAERIELLRKKHNNNLDYIRFPASNSHFHKRSEFGHMITKSP